MCLLALLQATEFQSHKWTVYMRTPDGEDVQHIIKKVRARAQHAAGARIMGSHLTEQSAAGEHAINA